MTTLDKDRLLAQRGQDLHDADGDKLGTIEEIYLDAESGQPEWAVVNTGLFGTKSSFVPLQGATEDGDTVRVRYSKAQVKDAPQFDADGELSQQQEAELYATTGSTTASRARTPGCPRAAPRRDTTPPARRSGTTPRARRPTTR